MYIHKGIENYFHKMLENFRLAKKFVTVYFRARSLSFLLDD